MAQFSMGNQGIKLILAAVGLAAVAAVVAGFISFRPAKVTGSTPAERISSICQLAADRPRGTLKAILAAAGSAEDVQVRKTALLCLGQFKEAKARSALVAVLGDPEPTLRATAASVLGNFPDTPVDTLLPLANDPDAQVQATAIGSLGHCAQPRAVVVLMQMAENDPSNVKKRLALESLLARLGARPGAHQQPNNPAAWRDALERVRRLAGVKSAYAAAGVPLVQHPEDIVPVTHHPDRKQPPEPTTSPG